MKIVVFRSGHGLLFRRASGLPQPFQTIRLHGRLDSAAFDTHVLRLRSPEAAWYGGLQRGVKWIPVSLRSMR